MNFCSLDDDILYMAHKFRGSGKLFLMFSSIRENHCTLQSRAEAVAQYHICMHTCAGGTVASALQQSYKPQIGCLATHYKEAR